MGTWPNHIIYTHLASLEDPQCADDHGDEGEVEDKQRDDESEQVNGQVADDKEENECVDMLRWDDCAEPLDSGSRCPVDQVLLHFNNAMQWILQHLGRNVYRGFAGLTRAKTSTTTDIRLVFI